MTPLPEGLLILLVLAMPVAAIAWTVTHEDIFKEVREYCLQRGEQAPGILPRKFFYLLTCEYCFSHYVTVLILLLTGFRLIYDDWRAYLISGLALVWVANHYMSLYGRIRIGIKSERIDVRLKEELHDKVTDG